MSTVACDMHAAVATDLFGSPLDMNEALKTLEAAAQLIRSQISPPSESSRRRSTPFDEPARKLVRFMTRDSSAPLILAYIKCI